MKILQSRFFKARRLLTLTSDSPCLVTAQEDERQYLSKYNPFESLLDDILPGVYTGNASLVIPVDLLEEFERCTDFYTVNYDMKLNQCYDGELCYFHPELEVFILANMDLSNEYDERIKQDGMLKISNVYYESINPQAPANMNTLFDRYLQKYESDDAKVSILLKETHGLVFKTHRIKPYSLKLNLMYNEDFAPVHEHIKNKLANDNKGVVLLHGIAGSGKTNYIKWLTSQVPNKQFIFVPTNMISYLTDPEFMSMLIDNKNSILVLEDCENYIAERTADDVNTDVVSSILNIADGMLSDILECQFICTFNSDISKVDEALLRKGRLIAEYKFGLLATERANAYLASIDSELRVEVPMSLAELTNIEEMSYKEVVKEMKIGFL
ncbi:AAA family ATPase [Psychrobacter arenosus]|uniref:AAA family ATPase n=1 Tax=Psychrobacter arenosus TaxID=256326 RepID=UPI001918A4E5|nr:AAA family ATPase [Psychrobacter arenosus]